MKRVTILALVLLVAGCATPPRPGAGARAQWLPGVWLVMESEQDRSLLACASGLPIRYKADGTYVLFEESGVWRLDGNRLTETATEASEQGDPAEVQIGRPHVSTLQRIDPDSFLKTFADGGRALFRRCPAVP